MVKKVKRFVVFILFSFFYSLLSSKAAEAAKVCLTPKSDDNYLKYDGGKTTASAQDVADEVCY